MSLPSSLTYSEGRIETTPISNSGIEGGRRIATDVGGVGGRRRTSSCRGVGGQGRALSLPAGEGKASTLELDREK